MRGLFASAQEDVAQSGHVGGAVAVGWRRGTGRAREAHFPATIADLYDPDKMPANLREAHERNDDTLERIYIGRRFKNDTERLEKLFELYTQMTAGQASPKKPAGRKKKGGDA
jgi:hypothetical protein